MSDIAISCCGEEREILSIVVILADGTAVSSALDLCEEREVR